MQNFTPVSGTRHRLDGCRILDDPRPDQGKLRRDHQGDQRRQPTGQVHIRIHQPAQHKDWTRANVNELATQPAFDDATMRKKVHEAQEKDRNEEREEGGEVGIHASAFYCGELL